MAPQNLEKELPLDPKNPCPFKQPFLTIRFRHDALNGQSCGWFLDVDGDVEKYVRKKKDGHQGEITDYRDQATPALEQLIDAFARHGWPIVHVGLYEGSGGPSHVLRNGAIFKRINLVKPL
jgi:hypothetical protein